MFAIEPHHAKEHLKIFVIAIKKHKDRYAEPSANPSFGMTMTKIFWHVLTWPGPGGLPWEVCIWQKFIHGLKSSVESVQSSH